MVSYTHEPCHLSLSLSLFTEMKFSSLCSIFFLSEHLLLSRNFKSKTYGLMSMSFTSKPTFMTTAHHSSSKKLKNFHLLVLLTAVYQSLCKVQSSRRVQEVFCESAWISRACCCLPGYGVSSILLNMQSNQSHNKLKLFLQKFCQCGENSVRST